MLSIICEIHLLKRSKKPGTRRSRYYNEERTAGHDQRSIGNNYWGRTKTRKQEKKQEKEQQDPIAEREGEVAAVEKKEYQDAVAQRWKRESRVEGHWIKRASKWILVYPQWLCEFDDLNVVDSPRTKQFWNI